MKTPLLRIASAVALLSLCAAAYAGLRVKEFLDTPPAAPGEQIFFDVEVGTPFAKVARQLAERGIVADARLFVWLARYKQWDGRLQAGRFALHTGWTPGAVLEQLVNGRPVLYRLTLREGMTWWETGRALEEAGFARFADFRETIADPEFLRRYGIPFSSAEGFLMPDTYLLKKPDAPDAEAARAVAGRLVDAFWRKTAPLWPEGKKPGPEELRRIMILASIVEKETAIAAERPRVAGVYANRLRIGMPLQADPTVIYGLGPAFDGNLRRAQINDSKNLYNTYQRAGLPPGPIASPGLAAIRAAMEPERHDYLYFVAKTDGGAHDFSVTLKEHNRAVRRYLDSRKKKKESQP